MTTDTDSGERAGPRGWPLVVRRARAEDRDEVLAFATRTWDGWDYMPHAFDAWVDADDGVMLVGTVGEAEGESPADREGQRLTSGAVVAVSRVARLSDDEAWVEGIRVDPRVRGLDVATDLQVAELHVAAPLATVVRYATGERNEASHRLGARHDFALLCSFRSYRWSATGEEEQRHGPDEPSGFDPEARSAATVERQTLLAALASGGLVAPVDEAAQWWDSLARDATFLAGERLYEYRNWALQELTDGRFLGHVQRGEVVVIGEPPGTAAGATHWALAILPAESLPSEDASLHLALVCGEADGALRLVTEIARSGADSLRFRLPEESPLASSPAANAAFSAAGFAPREWKLHILARPLDAANPPPPVDPAALVIEDAPAQ